MTSLRANLTERWDALSRREQLIYGGIGAALVVGLLAVIFAVCSGGDDEPVAVPTTATTTLAATTTTVAPTTTTVPPTTTTAPATVTVVLADTPGPELEEAVAAVYRLAAGDATAADAVPAPLAERIADADPAGMEFDLEGTAHWAILRTGELVAVAKIADDVVLAVDAAGEADTWRIVGAELPSLGLDQPWLGDQPRFVLVVGSDARWPEDPLRARADSLHILAVDADSRAAGIVGIPRDSWIETPGGSRSKFTSVLANSGPDAVLEAARDLSGLPIEGWITTGFIGFEIIVNDLGGLTIDLPAPIRGGIVGFPDFPAGTQTLSGQDLLLLARIRKTLPQGDFDRQRNHGLIMLSGLFHVQERGIEDLPLLLNLLVKSAHTTLDAEQLLTLGAAAYLVDPGDVENVVLPGRVGTVGDASVVFLDEAGTAAIFADLADGSLEP